MNRDGHIVQIDTPSEAMRASLAAVKVCTDEQLARKPEIVELFEIAEARDVAALPRTLSAGVSRNIIRGFRNDAIREGTDLSTVARRLSATIDLWSLKLGREPGQSW